MRLPLRTGCLLFFGAALIATTAWRVWRLDHPPARPHLAIASAHANDVIELRGLDGHTITVSFAGPRQKLLHIWASWCSPCVAELPLFAAVAPQLRQRGIDLILVALDKPEDAQRVLDREHLTIPTPLADDDAAGQLFSLGSSSGAVPFSLLFDSGGRMVRPRVGAVEGGAVELLGWIEGTGTRNTASATSR